LLTPSKKEQGIDLREDAMALQRLREAAEKAKKELSSSQATDINLPFITADSTGAKHLQMAITRAEFEKLIDSLVERCRKPVEQAMKDAGLDPSDIDEVVLVGGSTRVPKVHDFVKKSLGKDHIKALILTKWFPSVLPFREELSLVTFRMLCCWT